jgi:hypothetical protein
MWQGPDDAHPLGAGQTAYRVVYKTLKMVPYPAIQLTLPNLRVVFRNGDVDRGRATVSRTIPGRSPRHIVLPEYGRLVEQPGGASYLGSPDMSVEIQSEEDTVQALSYVEIIVHLDDVDPDSTYEELLARGRRAIGPLKTMLDLKFGPRLLAMPITEEIGETFDNWHWNRHDYTALLTVESQAALVRLEPATVVDEVFPLIEREQDLPEEEHRRLGLACQWYWRADAEPDRVTRYINWWIIVECLDMRKENDLAAVRRRLSRLFGLDGGRWGDVGRLYRLRSNLVHGNDWEVPDQQLQQVELLARVLLTSRLLFAVPDALGQEFLSAMRIALPPTGNP